MAAWYDGDTVDQLSITAERTEPDTSMSPEFYTIIAVSVAIAGLILNGQRATATAIRELRTELQGEFRAGLAGFRTELDALDARVTEQIGELREQMHQDLAALGERVARLEGLLEGLRDAITGRAA